MKVPALAFLLSTLGLFAGCASGPRTIALQTRATAFAAPNSTAVTAVQVTVADERVDRSLDVILNKRAADEAADAIRAALYASKLVVISADAPSAWEVHARLTRLEWEVPGYKAMLKKVFATSFLTGGIGGLAYGSTSTPVRGHAFLAVRFVRAGQEVFSREYVGEHEETLPKLKCDTLDTKSRVAGAALSDAIDKLVKDLSAPPTVVAAK